MKYLIDKLEQKQHLSRAEWLELLNNRTSENTAYLFQRACHVRHQHYDHDIYIRGLIEFTNYCKNDCFYCGIRHNNKEVNRYRLSLEDILECCATGYELGFRTFVLQGGEDPFFTDELMIDLIQQIHTQYEDCAITLSLGEKSKESYQAFFDAGATRYLLRHETANNDHYRKLHPASLTGIARKQCLLDLKMIGYEVGTGFMVGSPFQTLEDLVDDMILIKDLNPQMVGIGPFIPHHNTPFKNFEAGTLELTLFMIGLLRLMIPTLLIPSTTSLGTIDPKGRELGILAGANVVMPNLSPTQVRKDYLLYDNKICTGDEAAECRQCMEKRMESIGYQVVVSKGDSKNPKPKGVQKNV